MAPADEAKPPPSSEPDLPGCRVPAGPPSVSFSKDPSRFSASEGDSGGNGDDEARVGLESEGKPEDLDSDSYYNQEDEEVETGSVSSTGKGEVYNNLLSEFDDFVANEKNGALTGASRALSYGFEVGDMVWGKVKSHPWWPGHIFDDGLATSSVRRTRREGHVLVAFFGDSSYGWFDPAELVPFEDHFEEKSWQTSSRTFVRAVEEAVDEASRRGGLGLVCKCRNPYNFRPTSVDGYFAVDVPDFEPNGVYSEYQIRRARDEFRPVVMLDLVKRVAADPGGCDVDAMNFVKYKATVSGFRKAVFEEFDETYAQAFGVQSSKPSKSAANLSEQPARAPLSGPLVIAEALSGSKIAKKTMKLKDRSKKDKYVLKKRDDQSDENVLLTGQKQARASPQMAYAEDPSTLAGDYVLQKRTLSLDLLLTDDRTGLASKEVMSTLTNEVTKAEVIADQGAVPDANRPGDVEKMLFHMQDLKPKTAPGSAVVAGPRSTLSSDSSAHQMIVSPHRQHDTAIDHGTEETAKTSTAGESFQQAKSDVTAKVEADGGLPGLQDSCPVAHPASTKAKRPVEMTSEGGVVKKKLLKRPLGDNGSEISTTLAEKKKKKRKKEMEAETSSDQPKKLPAVGKGGTLTVNSIQDGLPLKDGPQIVRKKKDASSVNVLSNVGASLPLAGLGNVELDVPQLMRDLHALALGPFDGLPGNTYSISMQFFLRFRALSYQKSLVLSPPPEMEQVDAPAAKSSNDMSGSKKLARLNREFTQPKPEKGLPKTDDPAKISRKRMMSDRQEEISALRLKKLKHLKTLAEEKKTGTKALEPPRPDAKEAASVASQRPVKLDVTRKMQSPARSIEPTMLVMKFPPQTSLPSGAELKAKFARFGSIDLPSMRIFWKSLTCRVVYRYKRDALAAYKYAIANSSLFGNVDVRYSLREAGAPGAEAPESGKGRGDDTSNDALRVKDPSAERTVPGIGNQHHLQSGQLKSILKKPSGDEATQGTGGNGGRGTRVKFILGGEESTTSRGEQLTLGNRNNYFNSASFADDAGAGAGAPTSVATDFNSKNMQKVLPPSQLPPLLPLPPQFGQAQLNDPRHYTEVPPRNVRNSSAPIAPVVYSVDISQQMLSLLTRCNEVVSDVRGVLGYVPYHPL